MVRLGRLVVVDDKLHELEGELCDLNYTTYLIRTDSGSAAVKSQLRGKIFVTRDDARLPRVWCPAITA